MAALLCSPIELVLFRVIIQAVRDYSYAVATLQCSRKTREREKLVRTKREERGKYLENNKPRPCYACASVTNSTKKMI